MLLFYSVLYNIYSPLATLLCQVISRWTLFGNWHIYFNTKYSGKNSTSYKIIITNLSHV